MRQRSLQEYEFRSKPTPTRRVKETQMQSARMKQRLIEDYYPGSVHKTPKASDTPQVKKELQQPLIRAWMSKGPNE